MSLMSLISLISLPLRNAYFLTRGLIKLIKLPKLIKLKTQNINPNYETHWGKAKLRLLYPLCEF